MGGMIKISSRSGVRLRKHHHEHDGPHEKCSVRVECPMILKRVHDRTIDLARSMTTFHGAC